MWALGGFWVIWYLRKKKWFLKSLPEAASLPVALKSHSFSLKWEGQW